MSNRARFSNFGSAFRHQRNRMGRFVHGIARNPGSPIALDRPIFLTPMKAGLTAAHFELVSPREGIVMSAWILAWASHHCAQNQQSSCCRQYGIIVFGATGFTGKRVMVGAVSPNLSSFCSFPLLPLNVLLPHAISHEGGEPSSNLVSAPTECNDLTSMRPWPCLSYGHTRRSRG
jgi:hypothetical protein